MHLLSISLTSVVLRRLLPLPPLARCGALCAIAATAATAAAVCVAALALGYAVSVSVSARRVCRSAGAAEAAASARDSGISKL